MHDDPVHLRHKVVPIIAVVLIAIAWWFVAHKETPPVGTRPPRAPIPGSHVEENMTNPLEAGLTAGGGSTRLSIRAYGIAAGRLLPEANWLQSLPSDTDRWAVIEQILGGSGDRMLLLGERLKRIHTALKAGQFDFARLQMDKVAEGYRIYLLTHPDLEGSLDGWDSLKTAVDARDGPASMTAFDTVRQSCMSCHDAVGNGFVNQTGIFTETAPE